ncbi:MAG: bifunctional YncE family protein/alkaline phosphatase family protein [Bryobacterales bacterium]|nr:bifunctional YncE family protein/alkaline phosphatase family protein [Bryobacteraceae bacterium]MDW8353361.1 bifunctional YncE family protein/alkaline phosphatase family protein [Bryobacterales bacterium]
MRPFTGLLLAGLLLGQPEPGTLLPDGWRLRPAGRETPLDTLPMAATATPDGRYLLVLHSGTNPASVAALATSDGSELSRITLPDAWLGLALDPKGTHVYAGGGAEAAVFELSLTAGRLAWSRTFPLVPRDRRTARDFAGDVAVSPDGRLLYVAELFQNTIAVLNPQTGMVVERFRTGRRPFRILFHPDGKSLFVTSWADGSLFHHEAESGRLIERLRLAAHPTDMIWAPPAPSEAGGEASLARIFVAASNTNSIQVVGVTDSKELRLLESVNLAFGARQPAGMTASALALDANRRRVFVACSGANALAVVDIRESLSRVVGYIAAGWYPVALRVLPQGTLVVLNARRTDRGGGSASWIAPLEEEQLFEHSVTVLDNTPYRDSLLEEEEAPEASPVAHVVYVLRQTGRGPNCEKLAREFALLERVYASGPGRLGGLYRALAGIAPHFLELYLPGCEAGRRAYACDGDDPAAVPPAGYLWTNAAAAGISLRNYGFFVVNRTRSAPDGTRIETVRDAILKPVTDLRYPGLGPDSSDAERAMAFLEDLRTWEKQGSLPRLLLVRLSGRDEPDDVALGRIIEGLSHSRFWPRMAIFVAALGLDGDGWALVASPYARRGFADPAPYSVASLLRTIQLFLGLRPMTHFDAAAPPLLSVFQGEPDTRPYTAVPGRSAPEP